MSNKYYLGIVTFMAFIWLLAFYEVGESKSYHHTGMINDCKFHYQNKSTHNSLSFSVAGKYQHRIGMRFGDLDSKALKKYVVRAELSQLIITRQRSSLIYANDMLQTA